MADDLRAQVLERAWKDPEFREKVRSDPHGALKELGASIPDDIKVNVVEDDPSVFNLVLREPPSGSPDDIGKGDIDGGMVKSSGGAICTITDECGCPKSVTGPCSLFCPGC